MWRMTSRRAGTLLLCSALAACGQSASPSSDTPSGGSSSSPDATPCPSTCDDDGGGGSSGSSPGPDAGVTYDAGPPIDGSVSPDGGVVTRLLFASVGDTRPTWPDDPKSYPTDTITKIFTTIEAMSPRPSMVVSTGDYAFTLTGTGDTSAELDLYMGARAKYSGAFFPGLGNHECVFQTDSNCGAGTTGGMTKPYTNFLAKMLAPIGQSDPYYTVDVRAEDGTWTAKFVFTAPNAWTPAQAAWLPTAMAKPTTYTFVIRHEQTGASSAPAGLAASAAITSKYPVTLMLVGHKHTYEKVGPNEVLFGNGGAPVAVGSNKPFGFGVFSQRADGAIEVNAIDMTTGLADPGFRFAVKADGSPAP
jgi:Calcineurin-like phosphoesterase